MGALAEHNKGRYNQYATRDDVKAYLGIPASEEKDDALFEQYADAASRWIDRRVGRFFYEKLATLYFDWQSNGMLLLGHNDLLSVTTLTNDDQAVDSADYYLYPLNEYPKKWIEIHVSSGETFGYTSTPQRATNIVGLWGYHEDFDNRWRDSGDTVLNTTQISASGTSLTVADGSRFHVQHTLKIENEQVYVTDTTAATLTIVRGINGTTAATHATAKAIYIWEPMADIRMATALLAAQLYKLRDTLPFGRAQYIDVGVIEIKAAIPEIVWDKIRRYRVLT